MKHHGWRQRDCYILDTIGHMHILTVAVTACAWLETMKNPNGETRLMSHIYLWSYWKLKAIGMGRVHFL